MNYCLYLVHWPEFADPEGKHHVFKVCKDNDSIYHGNLWWMGKKSIKGIGHLFHVCDYIKL